MATEYKVREYKRGDPQPQRTAPDYAHLTRGQFLKESAAWFDAQEPPRVAKTKLPVAERVAALKLDDMPASVRKLDDSKRLEALKSHAAHFEYYAAAFARWVELESARVGRK